MSKPYERTAQALEDLLDRAEPGQALPSEPRLAQQLGVSRATLREAMSTLEDRGRIVRQQGVGTYIPPTVIEAGLEELVSIQRLAARVGLEVEMGDCEVVARPPRENDVSAVGVLEISRVIATDKGPVAYLMDTIPESLIPADLLLKDFSGSVLDLLLKRGEPKLTYSRTEIRAVAADREIASRLRVPEGAVLLSLEASLFAADGTVVDRSTSYFLPDIFKFHVVRRIGRGLGTVA